jgi:hypothetical protein
MNGAYGQALKGDRARHEPRLGVAPPAPRHRLDRDAGHHKQNQRQRHERRRAAEPEPAEHVERGR